jgi:hypothetical protein
MIECGERMLTGRVARRRVRLRRYSSSIVMFLLV